MTEYGKCVKCEKPMTELEAIESEWGAEFIDDLVCDECFDTITLKIAKGAFPKDWADCDMSDVECEMCEVIDCHRAA